MSVLCNTLYLASNCAITDSKRAESSTTHETTRLQSFQASWFGSLMHVVVAA